MKRPSKEQQEVIFNFMALNPEIARGAVALTSEGKAKHARLWNELALALNSLSGCHKNVANWRKYWSDRKLKIRKKKAILKSGGDQAENIVFSETENIIITLLGEEGDHFQDVKAFPQDLPNDHYQTKQNLEDSTATDSDEISEPGSYVDLAQITKMKDEYSSKKDLINGCTSNIPSVDKTTESLIKLEDARIVAEGKTADAFKDLTKTIKSGIASQNKLIQAQTDALLAFKQSCDGLTNLINHFLSK